MYVVGVPSDRLIYIKGGYMCKRCGCGKKHKKGKK